MAMLFIVPEDIIRMLVIMSKKGKKNYTLKRKNYSNFLII